MTDTRALGWPFLVARGRRRGHGVLLAPDFLVSAGEHGILETVGDPSGQLVTATGRRLRVGTATHLVTAEDTAEPGAVPNELLCLPRDEHGRPLRLIYGIVQNAPGVELPAADLRTARVSALDVYRRFLHAEDAFQAVPSLPFPLSGRLLAQPSTQDSARRRPRGRAVAALAGVSAVVAALAILWGQSGTEPAPVPRCPTSTPAPPSYSAQGDGGAPSGPVAQSASAGSSVSSKASVSPSLSCE